MQQRTIRAGANTTKANEGGKRGEEKGPVVALDRFVDDVNHFEGVLGVELALASVMIVALLILFLHLAPQTDLFLFFPGVLLLGTPPHELRWGSRALLARHGLLRRKIAHG